MSLNQHMSLNTLNYSSTSTVIEITQYLLSDDKTSNCFVSAILVFLYAYSVCMCVYLCVCVDVCVCVFVYCVCVHARIHEYMKCKAFMCVRTHVFCVLYACVCVCVHCEIVCVCSITCELVDSFSLMVTVLLGYLLYIVCSCSPCRSFPLNNFCCIHPMITTKFMLL